MVEVSISSERKQHCFAKTTVGENFRAEIGAFTIKLDAGAEQKICEVPFVYDLNLIQAVSDLVEKHRRYAKIIRLIK